MRSVLICSIHTMFLNLLLNGKMLQFHVFGTTRIFIVLGEKNCNRIITINFQWLGNGVDDPKS